MNELRDRLEDLWLRVQIDYEFRQYLLYAGILGAAALLELHSRRAETRRSREFARALAEAMNEGRRS